LQKFRRLGTMHASYRQKTDGIVIHNSRIHKVTIR